MTTNDAPKMWPPVARAAMRDMDGLTRRMKWLLEQLGDAPELTEAGQKIDAAGALVRRYLERVQP